MLMDNLSSNEKKYVDDLIRDICNERGTRCTNITETIYYMAAKNLLENKFPYYVYRLSTDLVDYAKKYTMTKINNNKDIASQEKRLLLDIMRSKNEDVIEIIMDLVAQFDNIQGIPFQVLFELHDIAKSGKTANGKILDSLYERAVDVMNTQQYTKIDGTYHSSPEAWNVAEYYQVVRDDSISSNNHEKYLSVLKNMPQAGYTDAATIMCPFTVYPAYLHRHEFRGALYRYTRGEYCVSDLHANIIDRSIPKTAYNQAGIRLTLAYQSVTPKNSNYIQIDESVTEYGYWPIGLVPENMQERLDNLKKTNRLKNRGELITGIESTKGYAQKMKSHCYEYDGEIYVEMEKKFNYAIGAARIQFSNQIDTPREKIWVRMMPLRCYVDGKTKHIITADLILSGMNPDNLENYLRNDFTIQLHRFDEFYKNKNNDKKPAQIEFSEDRKRFLLLLDKAIREPYNIIDSEPINTQAHEPESTMADEPHVISPEVNSSEEVEVVTKDESEIIDRLNIAIDEYYKLDRENIKIDKVDNYISILNRIFDELSQLQGIKPETVEILREQISKLVESNDPTNRMFTVLEIGPGAGLANDETSVNMAMKLIPMTDQIVDIISHNYRTPRECPALQNDKSNQLKEALTSYLNHFDSATTSSVVDGQAYSMLDSLHNLSEIMFEFITNDKIKQKISESIKSLDTFLDPNERIAKLLQSKNYSGFRQSEYNSFLEMTVDINEKVIHPIIRILSDTLDIKFDEAKPIPANKKRAFFEDLKSSFAERIPNWPGIFKQSNVLATDKSDIPTMESVRNRESIKKKRIEQASVEEAASVLSSFNRTLQLDELKGLRKLVDSKSVTFEMGKIGELVFVGLKNINDGTVYIYTNDADKGSYEFGRDTSIVSCKNEYLDGDKKRRTKIEQTHGIPPKIKVAHQVLRLDDDKINLSSGDKGVAQSGVMRKGDKSFKEMIPDDVLQILQHFSSEIANEIIGERIFTDTSDRPY